MWITKDTDAIWVKMELNTCRNVPLEPLPFLNEVAQKRLRVGNDLNQKNYEKMGKCTKEI